MEADAFQVLSRYLESLNDTYRNTDGGKEIVEDIEARIAELILSHQDNSKVVELSLVEEIIAQMGSAEAIREQEGREARAAKAGFRVACTGIWTRRAWAVSVRVWPSISGPVPRGSVC